MRAENSGITILLMVIAWGICATPACSAAKPEFRPTYRACRFLIASNLAGCWPGVVPVLGCCPSSWMRLSFSFTDSHCQGTRSSRTLSAILHQYITGAACHSCLQILKVPSICEVRDRSWAPPSPNTMARPGICACFCCWCSGPSVLARNISFIVSVFFSSSGTGVSVSSCLSLVRVIPAMVHGHPAFMLC